MPLYQGQKMTQEKTKMLKPASLSALEIDQENEHPCLAAINEVEGTTLFELKKSQNVFGRSLENEISLDMPGISRKHFLISLKGEEVTIKDLDSANGTFLNDRKLSSEEKLSAGDVIKSGSIALKFLPKNSPEIFTHKELIRKATVDGLTGCFNKKYFQEAFEREFENSKRQFTNLVLIIVDIDHFKNLNDTLGHDAGDAVLKELGQILKNKVKTHKRSALARFGGEEFVILLTDSSPGIGKALAEEIRISVEGRGFKYGQDVLKITLSLGVACFFGNSESGMKPTELFVKADKALYQSKEGGRNQTTYI